MTARRHLVSGICALGALMAVPGVADGRAAPSRSRVSVTQTAADLTQALALQPGLRFSPTGRRRRLPVIAVDDTQRMQRFLGAGVAMTDSSAWLIEDQLPAAKRNELMRRLFGTGGGTGGGIHLSFLRVPIGASDFTRGGVAYTYDDLPPGQTDPGLTHFSIAHDRAYILPVLRRARTLDRRLYVEALPWSPPAWMKTNDALSNINHAGRLLTGDEGVWARYLVRFVRAYAAAGVRVSALAVQNEPTEDAVGPGLELGERAEARFVRRYLRPALKQAHLRQPVFGWDLSWGALTGSDPLVRATRGRQPALRGLAWHCYFGAPKVMDTVHRIAPASVQIVDECGAGAHDAWPTAELLISSLRHWAAGIAYWNVALDPSGGPVHQPNISCERCTGVVTVHPRTGTYTPTRDFYALGQLTRFVGPGARRIASRTFVSLKLDSHYQTRVSPGLDDVALRNPDGSKVLLAYNNAAVPIMFQVEYRRSYVTYTIPARATATFTWR